MLGRRTAEWLAELEARTVPCGPINDLAGVFADPHIQHRRLQVEMASAEDGHLPVVASPLRLSQTPVEYRSAPPRLGAHTLEVLERFLNVDQHSIAALAADRVIRT
jgi:crotonobetainyl-CoA:carnitine CoA-transferase CaiB-like acyl-CoA transferase